MDKDELIAQAVQAHQDYLDGVEELKKRRQMAFRMALLGPVSARELSERIGLDGAHITKISKGQR